MKATDIQKILAEQRVISPIKDLTPAEINRKLSNEAKRKIPLDEYENIIKEYWVRDTVRPLHLANIIAERYGAHTVEKIVINYYKTLPANEYNQLVRTYNNKFGRSALMKQVHAGGNRDKVKAGEAISKAKNTITREDAVVIYELTFSCANSRTAKYYKKLAKQYSVSFGKIQGVANGHHPALLDRDVKSDVRQHEIKYLGIYQFTSPQGKEYVFDNLYDVGYFLWKTEHSITDKTSQQNWSKGRMWFEGKKANTIYVKKKRFWKGWEYINLIVD